MFDTPYIIPVVAIIAWAAVAIYRAKHGIANDGSAPDSNGASRTVKEALSAQDEEIGKLRERVRVLEKIAIDTHKSHHLSEEIDKLKQGQHEN